MICPICNIAINNSDAVSIDVNNTVAHLYCQNMLNKSVKKDEGIFEELQIKYKL